MMFDLAKFIVDNLTAGYANGSFTQEQVNIFAVNYLLKGQITQADFDYIQNFMNPKEEEPEEQI